MTHNVMIQGRAINITLAKITYRCGHCLAPIRIKDTGLKCTVNPEHKGFIHRDKAEKIKDQQNRNIKQLEQFYKIVDGEVKTLWQS